MSVEHHIARDLLQGYVEETLEAETAQLLESHLEACEECRRILDAAETPLDLPSTAAPEAVWNEKRLRKTIRRTIGRLIFDTLSIWIIGATLLIVASNAAIQPLLIARGDRVRAAALATWDLAVMTTPGASLDGWRIDSTLFGRELTVDVVRPIGSDVRSLGTYETDLGFRRFRGARGAPIQALFVEGTSRAFAPDRLPTDTVTTVELQWWTNPISVAQAEALRPREGEARLVWAGFDVTGALPVNPGQPGDFVDPGNALGYHACVKPVYLDLEDGYFESGSSGGSGTLGCFNENETVNNALNQVRRAVSNLASHAFLTEALSHSPVASLRNVTAVDEWLRDTEPKVVSLVVTGPTENVARLVESSGADAAIQLDVDFWNWEG